MWSAQTMHQIMHLILFYDSDCGLCDKAVQFVLQRDKKKQFFFAPLLGETAQEYHILSNNSVVLLKHGVQYQKAAALFGICWELGGFWKLPGLLFFLPACLLKPYDWLYAFIAKRRGQFCFHPYRCKRGEKIGDNSSIQRFLP